MEIWRRNVRVCWFGTFATSVGLSQIAPVLPLYINELGVYTPIEVEQLSGFAFGISFVLMAIFSPVWGRAADKFGRKPMLLRASLGMGAIIIAMAFVRNLEQFIVLRALEGTVSGFSAAAITLIATQAPQCQLGWALGALSTGSIAGTLIGPLIGGCIAEALGLRSVFLVTGTLLIIAFLASLLFVQEDFVTQNAQTPIQLQGRSEPQPLIGSARLLVGLLVITFITHFSLTTIQPILSVFVSHLSNRSEHIVSNLVHIEPPVRPK